MGSDYSNPKLNLPQPVQIWGGFGFNFVHKLGRILDLSNFTDSGLGSALTLSRVRIWTWIQIVLQVGLDSESIKFNGFGLGFNLFYRLGRIPNPLRFMDSDLDSTCSTGWVGFRIH